MPAHSRSRLPVLCSVAVGVASAAARVTTQHVDGGWLPGPGLFLVVAGVVFAFGLFWVNVLVHVTVPWRRVERFDGRTAALVGGALIALALVVLLVADLRAGSSWFLLPAVLSLAAVGYASVAGGGRCTAAAVAITVALFLAPGTAEWLLAVDGVVGGDVIRYPALGILALVAGCFTHAAGAIAATYRTRTA